MRKLLPLLALLMAAAILLPSCSFPASRTAGTASSGSSEERAAVVAAPDADEVPSAARAKGDTLTVATSDMTGVWSSVFSSNLYDIFACELMFDNLITADTRGRPVANAADYRVSKDGRTYTFTIKKGVKFWDGNAATARDVEFVYELLADPSYSGPVDLSAAGIKGYAAYHSGKAKSISGIRVLSARAIRITLIKPDAPALWTLGSVPLMEKAYYATGFKKGEVRQVQDKLAEPIGTGQYCFSSYSDTTGLSLTANEAYFKGAPSIARVRFLVTPQGREINRLKTGEADIAAVDCSEANMALLKATGFLSAYYFPSNSYGMIQWNLTQAQYADRRVRAALAYGLDRKAVVRQIFGRYAAVLNVPCPRSSWGYSDSGTDAYRYSPATARRLLAQAGWKLSGRSLTKNGKAFVIRFSCASGNKVTDRMLPILQKNYAKLGIKVEVHVTGWSAMLQNFMAGKTDAVFLSNGLSSPDPDQSGLFRSGGAQNVFHYSNKALDSLFRQEQNEVGISGRTAVFRKINRLLNSELPVFPVYQPNDLWGISARVENVPDFGAFRDLFLDLYRCRLKQ